MPYIDPELRAKFDPHIDELLGVVRTNVSSDDLEGVMNYITNRLVAGAFQYNPTFPKRWRYRNASRAYGTFLAAAAEFYRRVLSPVEDDAIQRNGDIQEYQL